MVISQATKTQLISAKRWPDAYFAPRSLLVTEQVKIAVAVKDASTKMDNPTTLRCLDPNNPTTNSNFTDN